MKTHRFYKIYDGFRPSTFRNNENKTIPSPPELCQGLDLKALTKHCFPIGREPSLALIVSIMPQPHKTFYCSLWTLHSHNFKMRHAAHAMDVPSKKIHADFTLIGHLDCPINVVCIKINLAHLLCLVWWKGEENYFYFSERTFFYCELSHIYI